MTPGGIFHYASNGEEALGVLTSLASYVSRDRVTWTATTNSPSQVGTTQAMAQVVLTDAEAASNFAVKFTTDRTDVEDLIVRFGSDGKIYAGGGSGDPVRCSRSGIYFPESRIRTSKSGRKFGDRFFREDS